MRTLLHLLSILCLGIVVGLAVRSFRAKPSTGSEPLAGEVVYGSANPWVDNEAVQAADVVSAEPSKPPAEEDWLSRFELMERSGEMVRSEDLKGNPYVVSFFFSTCPSICVQQNQQIKALQDEFEGQGVRFVAISVDPETDTPEVLREYAARFGADQKQWLFLTGELKYIRRIGGEIFRQPVNKQFHTERFVLVDPEGQIEGFYNWPEPRQLEALKSKIHEMLTDRSHDSVKS
ncbi:MAG: SCO family protein [Planctomycetota bacterium]